MPASKYLRLLPVLGLGLVVVGCASLGLRSCRRAEPTATPMPLYRETTSPPATPTLLPPTMTPVAVATSASTPVDTSTPVATALASSEAIRVEMTEAEVNEYLAGESFSQQGASISDLKVGITPEQMQIHGHVVHQATGIGGDITIRGTPQLVDGVLYFQIASVELGPQFSGLVRTVAQSMIQQAIRQQSGAKGIKIPVPPPEGITLTRVTLGDGKLLLEGVRS